MRLHHILITISLLLAPILATASESNLNDPLEGAHYIRIVPAQPTTVSEGKIEVVELFWYGCPHCFRLEPYLKKWKETLPENVVFRQIPGVMNPKWESHARAFYAAEVLGVLDKTHQQLFDALHIDRKRIFSQSELADFFEQQGVDREKFLNAYRSFAVSAKVRRSKLLGQANGISGVPTIIVNGKYHTSGTLTGSNAGMLQVTDALIKQELAESEIAKKQVSEKQTVSAQ
jgi:thiol:disulfide interchange protein DsbA